MTFFNFIKIFIENFKNKTSKIIMAEERTLTDKCCVCMRRIKNHANTNCGHMCICEVCVLRLNGKCPLCRSRGQFIKIYA